LPKKNIFAFSSTHLWNTTSYSIFELYYHVRHQKASKVLTLFISRKKKSICLFPTEISAVHLKNISFLKKRVKIGGILGNFKNQKGKMFLWINLKKSKKVW